jgi:hypothetical protein
MIFENIKKTKNGKNTRNYVSVSFYYYDLNPIKSE